MLQPNDPIRHDAVTDLAPVSTSRRAAVSMLMRGLALPMLACALLGLAACSSPTPSTPGDAANDVSEPVDDDGGAGAEAPIRGMPTMIPPGGGEEYFSITVEPTEDVGYPPPATKTFEERQLDAYPAPGDESSDESGEAEVEGGEDSDGTDEGDADEGDASEDGEETGSSEDGGDEG
jgi:hypothetical protein